MKQTNLIRVTDAEMGIWGDMLLDHAHSKTV